MNLHIIEEGDIWLFARIYSTLASFADSPQNVIDKTSSHYSLPDDQANDLDNCLRVILTKYPNAISFKVIAIAKEIDDILDYYSLNGPGFEEFFWTNEAFAIHDGWTKIRTMSRQFLLR